MGHEKVFHHSSRCDIHKLNSSTIDIDVKTLRESGRFQPTLLIFLNWT